MAPRRLRPVIASARTSLRRLARRSRTARRLMEIGVHELTRALDDDVYSGAYFGEGRNPLDRMGLSGYERYDRDTSNANVAAYLVWRFFDVRRTLDVGCATGFVVEALRELGVDAEGTDVSQWAIDHATAGARGHVFWGDLLVQLPVADGAYDLVTALETLEHLPPDAIGKALRELRRVTRGYVFATIPSFGANPYGPGGWFQHKVRHELVSRYAALGDDFEGPVPYDDLLRDAQGEPLEGHLTISSFAWWTKQFEAAGFLRCGAVEQRIHPVLARFGLTKYWNLYVFRVPDAPEPAAEPRTPAEVEEAERRFGLEGRVAADDDMRAVEEALRNGGGPGREPTPPAPAGAADAETT